MAKLVPFNYSSVGDQIWQSTFIQLFMYVYILLLLNNFVMQNQLVLNLCKQNLAVPAKSYKMFSDILKCFVR